MCTLLPRAIMVPVGCKYLVTGNQQLEPVVGYHAGRSWSLLASTAACVSLLACTCSGWTVIATARS
jgi:hypothetical protein